MKEVIAEQFNIFIKITAEGGETYMSDELVFNC